MVGVNYLRMQIRSCQERNPELPVVVYLVACLLAYCLDLLVLLAQLRLPLPLLLAMAARHRLDPGNLDKEGAGAVVGVGAWSDHCAQLVAEEIDTEPGN